MSLNAKATGVPNPHAVRLLLDAVDEFLWQQELRRRAAEMDRSARHEANRSQIENTALADTRLPNASIETDALETRLRMVCGAG